MIQIKVRSIFTTIVIWCAITVVLSLVGYIFTSVLLSNSLSGRDLIPVRFSMSILDDARQAFEEGGAKRLADYFEKLDRDIDGKFFLTDSRGIDLITGEDHSELAAKALETRRARLWRLPLTGRPESVRIHRTRDRQYRLITVLPARVETWEWVWYFLWLPIFMAGFCYVLAFHLASPLRGLRSALERFGRGDLAVRYHLTRRDEIGELARAFNGMADQITTLLSAERRLLQDVSHELRSPLARLGFAVELARTSPDRDASLTRIRKEADRLNQLVDELLQLTRAEGDPLARNATDFDLAALAGEVVADCTIEAQSKHCSIPLKADQGAILIGERELLRRAFDNVLRNAIRYAPNATTIDVGLTSNGQRATFTVRDYGQGVPPESLETIFKPFYRVDHDRDRASGGVGLGLAIARRAIELHQGRISARNANPGLIVTMDLPLTREG
jgi:two-component system sensor histidine kinase CpxA